MDLLRRKFIENYNMEMVSTDLIYLIDEIDTTGSALSCLELMEFMFSKALNEKQKASVKSNKN